ncbi:MULTISPECIES: hypothetical protein [unclassified Coleofasciculus]|uniref:hypothetical protein n=1 Tax=Cyanophyceae TaxID=3028117 RepID=UPI001685B439|nr:MULTISPECIES: hypothetical protein [unclassified Coleofasciculus]MBD1893243.1 hypothetical protein [Coleofasciculus sp. FACHB-129]MBD2540048.1 hypothetical protein [Coleofasciculus sp. FACHB-SPT36]
MMIPPSQPQPSVTSNVLDTDVKEVPSQYKGWSISTKVIDGKLWLRWQHPQESFPRFGCPVNEAGLASTIGHVRFLIDLAIKLESGVPARKPLTSNDSNVSDRIERSLFRVDYMDGDSPLAFVG